LYEHSYNVASLAVERKFGDEEVVLFGQIWAPEGFSLAAIQAEILRLKTVPIDEDVNFRAQLRLARLPRLIRRLCWWLGFDVHGYWRMVQFGTFGITGVANLGADLTHFLSPLTSTVSVSGIQADGRAKVRLMWDHSSLLAFYRQLFVDAIIPRT
jgi:hypothetical protein